MHKIKKAGVTFKYNCKEGEYKTDDNTEYTSHSDHHNNFKCFKCGNCKDGIFSQSHLTNHLKNKCKTPVTGSGSGKDAAKNEEECSKCGQMFKSHNVYKVHFMEKHVKMLTREMHPHCDICLYVFFSQRVIKPTVHTQQNMKRK